MSAYRVFLALHIVSGVMALTTFWSAAWLKKGSPRHRAVGRAFFVAMCGILVSGVAMTVHFFLQDKPKAGVFLGYLLVITAQAMWLAWHAVKDKRDWRAMVARPAWRGLMWLCAASGVAVLTLGIRMGEPLFIGFSLIGIALAVQMRRFERTGPRHANWHVVQHYQAILGCAIATHVAFLGIAMRPVWAWLQTHAGVPHSVTSLVPWFGPVIVAMAAGVWLKRKWARPLRVPRVDEAAATASQSQRVSGKSTARTSLSLP